MKNNLLSILIGGDFFPGRGTEKYVINNPDLIWGDSIEIFNSCDYIIINLEAPVTEESNKIIKTGPHLKVPSLTLKSLNRLNINAVTLANNHIRDYGDKGVLDTLDSCKSYNIEYVGAGLNLKQASKILYKEIKNKKIAFINIAENEWSSATPKQAGANPLDIINVVDYLKEAKKFADVIILIIHGGHEHYQLPSPDQVKRCRFFADMGANAIVCHHPHCYSGYEIYNDVPIFYSLGNLFFPNSTNLKTSEEGFLLKISISGSNSITFTYHPYIQYLNNREAHLDLMKEKTKVDFFEKIYYLNSIITDKDKLDNNWQEFSKSKENYVNSLFISQNIFLNKVIRKTRMSNLLNNKKITAFRLNQIRCESHLELTKNIFQNKIDK